MRTTKKVIEMGFCSNGVLLPMIYCKLLGIKKGTLIDIELDTKSRKIIIEKFDKE